MLTADQHDLASQLNALSLNDFEKAADQIKKSKRILVIAGAGISVSAGIPDFRTPGTGLYDNLAAYNLDYAEQIFDINYYRYAPEPFGKLAQTLWPGEYKPTLTHKFLKALEPKLLRIYTQNIDGLERLSGIEEKLLMECHGHFRSASCIDCQKAADIDTVKETFIKGDIPVCDTCNANVKPDIVFFGESLPSRYLKLVSGDTKLADLCIVIGTSLQVPPVAYLPESVDDCPRILINREVVGTFGTKDTLCLGDCDTVCAKLAKILDVDLRHGSDPDDQDNGESDASNHSNENNGEQEPGTVAQEVKVAESIPPDVANVGQNQDCK